MKSFVYYTNFAGTPQLGFLAIRVLELLETAKPGMCLCQLSAALERSERQMIDVVVELLALGWIVMYLPKDAPEALVALYESTQDECRIRPSDASRIWRDFFRDYDGLPGSPLYDMRLSDKGRVVLVKGMSLQAAG